ncbi:transposase [Sorangium sp. So ce321]|uniref:transposase n=1 Tax=Sorangium sp. So ce321 TaxID=3133300 RepID=UPI003F61B63B
MNHRGTEGTEEQQKTLCPLCLCGSFSRGFNLFGVLEHAVGRMLRYLLWHGHLEIEHDVEEDDEPEAALCASAVSGREPPADPQWLRGLSPSCPSALAYDKPLCAALDGFTLHAATRAGAHHAAAREALLCYVLRPPLAKERVEPQQDGLVRLSLKRAFADGTVAVNMDPLSLLCRLAASVPPPRFHTVKYAGVLASASPWRKRIGPRPAKPEESTNADDDAAPKRTIFGDRSSSTGCSGGTVPRGRTVASRRFPWSFRAT